VPDIGIEGSDVERHRLLAIMRMAGAAIDMQVLHLRALQRAAGDHAFHRLFQHPFRMPGFQAGADRPALDAAGIAGVVVEHRLVQLVAGDLHLGGVDDDDVVAAIHVRGELRLVLATQPVGDDNGQTAQNDALGIDQDPGLLHLRRLDGGGGFQHENGASAIGKAGVMVGISQPVKGFCMW
jgi:hypothetical protein